MSKFLKLFGALLSFVVLSIIALISYIKMALPNVGEPDQTMKIQSTNASIERGKYLANNVAVCMDCHSTRDWSKYSAPIVEGTLGKGGEAFTKEFGFPGNYYSKNITPFNLKDWSDGEIYRCITTGVTKNGKALFPVMPYPSYGKMADSDIKAIISYIRTLKPIESTTQESNSNFPMNIIINTIPSKANPSDIPNKKDSINYGAYLVNVANCAECHTKAIQGKKLEGMDFAGGFEFNLPFGTIRSANISPDNQTGIGKMKKEDFIKKFKSFDLKNYIPAKVRKEQFNTVMPWTMYSGMNEEDLGAIYEYLRTVKPVNNKIEVFTPKS